MTIRSVLPQSIKSVASPQAVQYTDAQQHRKVCIFNCQSVHFQLTESVFSADRVCIFSWQNVHFQLVEYACSVDRLYLQLAECAFSADRLHFRLTECAFSAGWVHLSLAARPLSCLPIAHRSLVGSRTGSYFLIHLHDYPDGDDEYFDHEDHAGQEE